mmetsp:Transcript_8239/g.30388  ORF Transcript_8239/g.30388 Transcript_8239/m.30388 type:complete len:201 (+) Transcript_8239:712-1314(+)
MCTLRMYPPRVQPVFKWMAARSRSPAAATDVTFCTTTLPTPPDTSEPMEMAPAVVLLWNKSRTVTLSVGRLYSLPKQSQPDLRATPSSPFSTCTRSMSTLVQESGSTPSVLGESKGARMVTSRTTTSSQYTGCSVQKGELRSVRLATSSPLQLSTSTSRPRVCVSRCSRCCRHHTSPCPSMTPPPVSVRLTMPSPCRKEE